MRLFNERIADKKKIMFLGFSYIRHKITNFLFGGDWLFGPPQFEFLEFQFFWILKIDSIR